MPIAEPLSEWPEGRHELERARRSMPGGVNSATRSIGAPYAFANGEGAYIVDIDHNRYLDYHAAFGANLLGYRNEEVSRAVAEAATDHALLGLGVSPLEIEFAEIVCESIPSAEVVAATMSGSEAVTQALRLARAATGRSYVVKFQGGFHGSGDSVARNVISSAECAYEWDPISSGILSESLTRTLVAEFNDIESVRALISSHSDQIAAVVVEPVLHNIGCLVPREGFLQELRRLCTANGIVLVFDEVITGFRHALGGVQELADVTPDLTTFGKAIGNGYPVAGLAGRREIMSEFNSVEGDVLLAGTFNGHPVSMAAAIATVRYLRENGDDFYPRTTGLASRMREGLSEIVSELSLPATAVSYGSVFVLYFIEGDIHGYRDILRNDDVAYIRFHREMFDRGVSMLPLSLKRNHVSGAHTQDDIDRTLEIARDVLSAGS